jgi:hypothetical protein
MMSWIVPVVALLFGGGLLTIAKISHRRLLQHIERRRKLDEKKAELKLWFDRIRGPDADKWIQSDEFLAASRLYQDVFAVDPAALADPERAELREFVKGLSNPQP